MCIDEQYVAPLSALVTSILANMSEKRTIEFNIMGTSLSNGAMEHIRSQGRLFPNCRFNFLDMSAITKQENLDQYTFHVWPKETFYRLYAPRLFPKHGKMLYLDTDMIVLGDIGELYDTDISSYYAAVVPGMYDCPSIAQRRHSSRHPGMTVTEYFQNYLGKKTSRAFNAGMVLFNFDLMRRDGKDMQLIPFLLNKPKLDLLDQCVLNAVLEEKLLFVNRRWNVCRNMKWNIRDFPTDMQHELEDAFAHPGVFHYTTALKPWIMQRRDLKPLRYWWYYYFRSACEGTPYAIQVRRENGERVTKKEATLYRWLMGGRGVRRWIAKCMLSN